MDNALDLFKDLGVEAMESGHHHCRPGWIQLRKCPWCGSSNYLLGYNTAAGFFSCWKCGGHPSVATWIKLGLKKNLVKDAISLKTVPVRKRERTRKEAELPQGVSDLLPAHIHYLEDRGLDVDRIQRIWKVQGLGLAGRYSWRVFIPIYWEDVLVSWTTRAIGDRVTQRYLSASAAQEAINHKSLVYGMDYCRNSIIIVEGPVDAWRIGPGAGALFGTAFSTAQIEKLSRIPYRYIVFDSGSTAQRKAEHLANELACFPGVTERIELDAKDPGEASEHELNLLRKLAKRETL